MEKIAPIECELDNGEPQGNFCDARLLVRGKQIIKTLYEKVGSGLSGLGGAAEIKAAYRFFDNDKTTPEVLLGSHFKHTISRVKNYPVVGLIQDTTDLDYKHMKLVEGLGVLNDTKRPGCSLHAMVAFTPDKLCLGAVHIELIHRSPDGLGKKKHNNLRPIQEKESDRWLKAYKAACKVAEETKDTQIVVIGDRESDIYELFVEASKEENRAELLVRGWHDIKISHDNESNQEATGLKKLQEHIRKAPVVGTSEFTLPKGRGRSPRQVKQNIRGQRVILEPSNHKKHLPQVAVNVVLLEEANVPEGEDPISWLLLTSLPISSEEEIKKVVDLYISRWGIEMYFKVLKSGCQVERLQLKEASRLLTCVAMFMIVAWRVMYAGFLSRTSGDLPCSILLEKDEWQAVYAVTCKKKPPKHPPPLEEIMQMIAALGGHRGRKGDSPPGIKTMWKGLQQVYQLSEGWRAAKSYG